MISKNFKTQLVMGALAAASATKVKVRRIVSITVGGPLVLFANGADGVHRSLQHTHARDSTLRAQLR